MIYRAFLLLAFVTSSSSVLGQEAESENEVSVSFLDTSYTYRRSENGQHEFTPSGQEDLSAWTDKISLICMPEITDGKGLNALSENVKGFYDSSGVVLSSGTVPKTETAEAQHLVVAGRVGDGLLDVVMARLLLVEGSGTVLFYSRRTYGDDATAVADAWLVENSAKVQNALMKFADFPDCELLTK